MIRFIERDLFSVLEEMAFLSEEVDWLMRCRRPPAARQLLERCRDRLEKADVAPAPPFEATAASFAAAPPLSVKLLFLSLPPEAAECRPVLL